MNPEKISNALGALDDRYINEALTYKKKRKIMLPLSFAASFIIIFSAAIIITIMGRGQSLLLNGAKISETPMTVNVAGRTAAECIPLSVDCDGDAEVKVSGGSLLSEGESSEKITVKPNREFMWIIDRNTEKSGDNTLTLSSSQGTSVYYLQYDSEAELWKINKK